MKKIAIPLTVIGIILLAWFGFSYTKKTTPLSILSFEDCIQQGYPVTESMPRQCRAPDGRIYTEKLQSKITYTNSSSDMIVVDLPFPGAVTGKTFSVIGKARGNWFFEASFPIQVLDNKGKVIAQGIAQAESDWMTAEFVPFKATLQVPNSFIGTATLLIKKDNPSGLPEHDASISFPITIEY